VDFGFNGDDTNVEEKERTGGLDARGSNWSGSGNGWGTSRAGGALGMRGNAEVEASGDGVGGDVGAGVGVADLEGSGGTSKGLVLTNDDGNIAWQWEMKGRGGRG
jgi:hypothetical protein